MSSHFFLRSLSAFLFFLGAWACSAADGYAAEATGGAGGRIVTVRSAEELRAEAGQPGKSVIQIEGRLSIGSINVSADKSLIGIGYQPTLQGNLVIGSGATNILIQNLTITNPMSGKGKGGGDGITVRRGGMVWIDHCSFVDCGDGCIDITEGANAVTVSWCKFSFTKQPEHRFTMLVSGLAGASGLTVGEAVGFVPVPSEGPSVDGLPLMASTCLRSSPMNASGSFSIASLTLFDAPDLCLKVRMSSFESFLPRFSAV